MTELITVSEAATRLGVTETYVRLLARTGKLSKVRKTPRKTMITVNSVEALINENNNSKQHEAVDAN